MAVDRKADHVGNHGGAYTDIEGNRRQFTVIDHDPKTKISGSVTTDKEKQIIKEGLSDYRKELIERILAIPASLCPLEFSEFKLVGDSQSVILWNEKMVRDEGMTVNRLRDLCTILERRFESHTI